MARIFYHTATGIIHGVHPGPFPGSLPNGVDFIDVPEAPDQILWPDARGERYNKVDSGALATMPFTPEPESVEWQAIRALAAEIDARTTGARAKIDVLLEAKV